MSRNDHWLTPDPQQPEHHLFSHQSLELTLVLLRYNNPSLATAVQQTLWEMDDSAEQAQHFYAELVSVMEADTIGNILCTLSRVAQRMLLNRQLKPEQRRLLQHLLTEWADLVEWVLLNCNVESRRYH
ncbi:hypothetical protein [Marinimicrobium alkaliphilum]|uniref:hypothetical protein n=1 Tax=Marinimicrobium alkaliphilum TaxID=2202654 RepID=UPI000DB990B9|nr:hypothetical protein [Marinimicrobium alkaliphilum]